MYILNDSATEVHNSDFVERFRIVEKPDFTLVIASTGRETQPNTLGRYDNPAEARRVLLELFAALYGGAQYYEMPQRASLCAERQKKDARTKRKGGS